MHEQDPMSNTSGNADFSDVVARRFSRRGLLTGSLAAAAATFVGGGTAMVAGAGAAGAATGTPSSDLGVDVMDRLGFTAIAGSTADDIHVPPGYISYAILPWGTPLWDGVADFDPSNTAADQQGQVGMGHDGMHFFPTGPSEGLLVFNLEYTNDNALFPDGTADWDADKTAKSQAAHGVCIAKIAKIGGTWQLMKNAPQNRRLTANSPMEFSGAAAGSPLLRSADHPRGRTTHGTVNNCGSGATPWNTYLTCEENFNGYFYDLGEGPVTPAQQALFDRYGVGGTGFGYFWATTDETWRADLHPNRPNQYGWVVEIDPFDPTSTPVKHTNLGRFKHESAWVATDDEQKVAVYMGDDERGEYIYKFASTFSWPDAVNRRGEHPFDTGQLLTAKFNDDGTGEWLPLVHGLGPLRRSNGWMNQADVLVRTRSAADALGATRMDRPEWVSGDPTTGDIYVACTNNTRRGSAFGIDAPNPRGPNNWGHIIRIREGDGLKGTEFTWDIFMMAGPGDGVDGSTVPTSAAFGSPDAIWHDADGRLWIQTDGSQPDTADSNDQMLACDPLTGQVKRFLTGPKDCEITGITSADDQATLFINVQHPGNGDPSVSNWPDGGSSVPRPAVVVIEKEGGGTVGT